jgi:hypothetical protein
MLIMLFNKIDCILTHLFNFFIKLNSITLVYLFLLTASANAAQHLTEVELNEENIVLMNVKLNDTLIIGSLDGYLNKDKLLIAIEPLFDTLKLQYKLFDNRVVVWKDDDEHVLFFTTDKVKKANKDASSGLWVNDGFYIFIDIETIAKIFNVAIDYNAYQLTTRISTKDYLFPKQKLAILEEKRILSTSRIQKAKVAAIAPNITIPDQYRLFTIPHGRVNTALAWDNDKRNNNLSLQLTSDLLYHSANLTLSKDNESETAARLQFSRYKSTPDESILGAFDFYSLGDVSGFSRSLINSVNSGVGAIVSRTPKGFRHQNLSITIKKIAPPGWEVELYHNNRFILNDIVPADGLLLLEDVETEYGQNFFQIKLFGPYGEEKIIEEYVDLTRNALGEGDISYSAYALDGKHKLINDKNDAAYSLTDFGGALDYGISDRWQIGLAYFNSENINSVNGETLEQISMKNAFSFPSFLFENDLAIDANAGYAQLSTLIGNGFGTDRYSIIYESAHNFQSSKVSALLYDQHKVNASYSGFIKRMNYLFSTSYEESNNQSFWKGSNRLSYAFNDISVGNTLTYSQQLKNGNTIESSEDSNDLKEYWSGILNIAGRISPSIRLSSSINYDPKGSHFIKDNSNFLVQWQAEDPFGLTHYVSGRYNPLTKSSNKWQLNHSVAWNNDNYQFTFSSNYNADSHWGFQAGIRFFLGYDYHNKKVLMSSKINSSSATLDAHTYLDRQLNGRPDPLDFNLAGVSFQGNEGWEDISSGVKGKTILPGIMPNGPFRFGAKWQVGSETINNDYVVYTHPGSYIEANMPFYLTTEFTGFVVRENGGQETPLRGVRLELLGEDGQLIRETLSDDDGFFEFTKLLPHAYQIKVADKYLRDKGYTAEVIGYKLPMLRSGGFVELDPIALNRVPAEGILYSEALTTFKYTEDNSEAIVWDDNENKRKEFFLLPNKTKIKAEHVLNTPSSDNKYVEDTTAPLVNKFVNEPVKSLIHLKTEKAYIEGGLPQIKVNTLSNTFEKPNVKKNDEKTPTKVKKDLDFIVQLGVYKDINAAKLLQTSLNTLSTKAEISSSIDKNSILLHSVVFTGFSSIKEAKLFANENLPPEQSYYIKKELLYKSNEKIIINPQIQNKAIGTLDSDKWVVQFYAGKFAVSENLRRKYSAIGSLYLAKKMLNKNNTSFYCLISQTFASKVEALNRLEASGVKGWVTKSDVYSQVSLWTK